MVAPYAGWNQIASFVDHDSPDYTVDGRIVIANGVTATSTDGQSSDFFPAYWSPELRQYINYDGHNGYDFELDYQPVLAAADGKVIFAGWDNGGYGNMVLIRHRSGYETLYGHLSQFDVQVGDRVKAGQQIAISGNTGRSTGPHLHFTVMHNCAVVDPYGWTGRGQDPLVTFGGERATYLWLPGHDPLVLNPPPHWPTYPVGLQVAVPSSHLVTHPVRVPPVDRLLLLKLPSRLEGSRVTTGFALARTESHLTAEIGAISPALRSLKGSGSVTAIKPIPAAGAVWVRGTASSQQLETLPGVASLSGVRPRDLQAAESGLAHSVLIQVGRHTVPSLWPAGFRSAVDAYRPIVTTLIGDPLVAGFSLPGQPVVATLMRRGSAAAAGLGRTDAQTGGFVLTLHDRNDNPVPVAVGDTLQVKCGGRSAQVQVGAVAIGAGHGSLRGTTRPGAPVVTEVAAGASSLAFREVVRTNRLGQFNARLTHHAPGGTLVVAGVPDSAGDETAAAARVAGLRVVEGSSVLEGWTSGLAPVVSMRRGSSLVGSWHLIPSSDGRFRLNLSTARGTLSILPGDRVTLGTRPVETVLVPHLHVQVRRGSSQIGIVGPAGRSVGVYFAGAAEGSWATRAAIPRRGWTMVQLPAPAALGDSVSASLSIGSSFIQTAAFARGFNFQIGRPTVQGRAAPGDHVTVTARDAGGKLVASAWNTADPANGRYAVTLADRAGHPAAIEPGMRLTVAANGHVDVAAVPSLSVSAQTGSFSIRCAPGTTLTVVLRKAGRALFSRQETVGATGAVTIHLGSTGPGRSYRITAFRQIGGLATASVGAVGRG